jgi:hypothetical protein
MTEICHRHTLPLSILLPVLVIMKKKDSLVKGPNVAVDHYSYLEPDPSPDSSLAVNILGRDLVI